MLRLILFGFVLQQAAGVIYRLTPAEYDLLPRLTAVDAYAPCMRAPGDVYCHVSADLRGNRSDPLYNTLVEYSESILTHFNHTKLRRGICPKTSCAAHMKGSSNLTVALEACLNATLSRQYRLTARVSEALCEPYRERAAWDAGDYAYAAAVLTLLALNLLGTLYDFSCAHGKDTGVVGRLLLCFAVRRSWRRLVAPSSAHPMHRRVRLIHCMRTMTAFGVVLGHSPIPALLLSNDPQFLEETYHSLPYQIIYNGTAIVQTFFLISGFLLAYNIMLLEEKRPATWRDLPKAVVLRWLRLTPPYALVMFYVMTWARHLSHGPFSLVSVLSESRDCHRNWWRHLLYVHNYQDGAPCMVHAWYLGAEFQLSVAGLVLFCALRGARARRLAVAAALLLGLLLPVAHTALQDLHPILIPSPEVIVNFFAFDPTFNNLYKRGHTNLLCYALGLALAFPVYRLKESDLGAERFKKFRVLYWLLPPLMVLAVLSGAAFYAEGAAPPLAARAVYAGAFKLVFGFLTALFMFFTIVKVDSVCRGVLHWGGWARASRLTYLAYLVHVPLLRYSVGNSSELVSISAYWIAQNYASCLLLSFTLAAPLFLLVELPLAQLVKVALLPAPAPAPAPAAAPAAAPAPAPAPAAAPAPAPAHLADGGASKETLEMKL